MCKEKRGKEKEHHLPNFQSYRAKLRIQHRTRARREGSVSAREVLEHEVLSGSAGGESSGSRISASFLLLFPVLLPLFARDPSARFQKARLFSIIRGRIPRTTFQIERG